MADANQKNTNSSKSSGSDKKNQPAKAPLCHHNNGDCEADIPVEVLQNAGVLLGQYCETPEEERSRIQEQVCWYDECYHPE